MPIDVGQHRVPDAELVACLHLPKISVLHYQAQVVDSCVFEELVIVLVALRSHDLDESFPLIFRDLNSSDRGDAEADILHEFRVSRLLVLLAAQVAQQSLFDVVSGIFINSIPSTVIIVRSIARLYNQ